MVEPEFDVLLLEAIDEALSAQGDSIMQTVYFHVERSFHIKKHEIPYRLARARRFSQDKVAEFIETRVKEIEP